MTLSSSLKYATVVVVLVALAVSAAYFGGSPSTSLMSERNTMMTLIAVIGALLIGFRGPILGEWHALTRVATPHDAATDDRSSADTAPDQFDEDDAEALGKQTASRIDSLKFALRDGSLRRQPRFLIAGDEAVVTRFMPELAEHGWLSTGHALLLWGESDADGRPDALWLEHVYKLRRRRPVDAVILTLDGTAEPLQPRRGSNANSVILARIVEVLHWSAPVYVLDVAKTDVVNNGRTALIGCEFSPNANEASIEATLLALRSQLGDKGLWQLARNINDEYGAKLSRRMDTRTSTLAALIASLANRKARHQSVSGAFFAPYPVQNDPLIDEPDPGALTSADLPLWTHLAIASRKARGRRMNRHPMTVFSTIALTVIGVWIAGMGLSGVTNGRDVLDAQHTVRTLKTASDPAARLQALLALQERIAVYEQRVADQSPLWARFGLNQDAAILDALWAPYDDASKAVIVAPIQQNLETTLLDLSQMPTDTLGDHENPAALEGHKALKTYLMLANPDRVDAGFITPQLMHYWSTSANVPIGAKLDISERLLEFYAQHLNEHKAWRIEPRTDLVNASRQTLLTVIGTRNSEDTLYQNMLAGAGDKYPDQTLASLTAGTDTSGLIRTTATVPGIYTRQAYENYVADAIGNAAKRSSVTSDWVLAEPAGQTTSIDSTVTLEQTLTAHYFNDYAEHWQTFMNALQWQAAPNLAAAIEQMKLLADMRESPVIALMKSLSYQGTTGVRQLSVSDSLVAKAKDIFSKNDGTQTLAASSDVGPLSAAFGPVLRLNGQASGSDPRIVNNVSDVSLQRYLERVTALRLKLQALGNGTEADEQARQLAQALFQGKSSELADTQAYAQLIAASLGAQWSGMGDTLFVRPVAQATQIVLQPAQASLNDAWRQSVVANWNKSFAGRYPFNNTDNDASIPELSRFIKPQGGLISAFLTSQLAGVLELQGDQWVAVNARGGALQFDPAFLNAVNTLQRIAGHAMTQGDVQYRFDLKPIPTPGITDTLLAIDSQKLHYFNQRERWQGLQWPSNDPQVAGTRLQWQTETAGTSKNFEFAGRWALIRMLERARVEPVDSATFQLTWQAEPDTRMARGTVPVAGIASTDAVREEHRSNRNSDDWDGSAGDSAILDSLATQPPMTAAPATLTYPLSYFMRTDVGKGPLELLALRGFALPNHMFIEKARVISERKGSSPPPLPRAAIEAARHAVTPLPSPSL